MLTVFASSTVDRFFEYGRVNLKTIRLVFVASPLSTQHYGKRAKTGDLIDFLVFNATFSNVLVIIYNMVTSFISV